LNYPSESTFFSLTPEEAIPYRNNVFTQIHEIIFHGKGGYDYNTIYNMPIWLRKFTFHKINKWYEEQNSDGASNSMEESIANMRAAGATKKQPVPDYVTKASKK
jgi:hypothetical protein